MHRTTGTVAWWLHLLLLSEEEAEHNLYEESIFSLLMQASKNKGSLDIAAY